MNIYQSRCKAISDAINALEKCRQALGRCCLLGIRKLEYELVEAQDAVDIAQDKINNLDSAIQPIA